MIKRRHPEPVELGAIVELEHAGRPVAAWVVGTCWHHGVSYLDIRHALNATRTRFNPTVEWNVPASRVVRILRHAYEPAPTSHPQPGSLGDGAVVALSRVRP